MKEDERISRQDVKTLSLRKLDWDITARKPGSGYPKFVRTNVKVDLFTWAQSPELCRVCISFHYAQRVFQYTENDILSGELIHVGRHNNTVTKADVKSNDKRAYLVHPFSVSSVKMSHLTSTSTVSDKSRMLTARCSLFSVIANSACRLIAKC